jgi:tetratricopeptide (TPR) repeat protein
MTERCRFRLGRCGLLRGFLCTVGVLLSIPLLATCSPAEAPPEALTQYLRAEDFYVRGQVEAALAIFSRVSQQHPELSQATFMEGKSLYLLNKPREAEAVLEKLVRRVPRYHEAQIWLARIEVQQGELDKAEKLLAELLSLDSQDARLLYLMAQVRTDQGKLQEAITYLEKAGATEEDLARVHLDLGRLYYRFGLDSRSHRELARALLLLPPSSPLVKPVTDLLVRIKGKE